MAQASALLLQGIAAHRQHGKQKAADWYAGLLPEQQKRVDEDAETLVNDWLKMLNSVGVQIIADARAAGMNQEEAGQYAVAVLTYLGLAQSNFANRSSNLVTWESTNGKPRNTFPAHYLKMAWDYAEVNPFGPSGFMRCVEQAAAVLEKLPAR